MVEKKSDKEVGQIKIVQIASPIGRNPEQRRTLVGLGLNKIRRERVLENTCSVRGMVNKVRHLVKFEIVN